MGLRHAHPGKASSPPKPSTILAHHSKSDCPFALPVLLLNECWAGCQDSVPGWPLAGPDASVARLSTKTSCVATQPVLVLAALSLAKGGYELRRGCALGSAIRPYHGGGRAPPVGMGSTKKEEVVYAWRGGHVVRMLCAACSCHGGLACPLVSVSLPRPRPPTHPHTSLAPCTITAACTYILWRLRSTQSACPLREGCASLPWLQPRGHGQGQPVSNPPELAKMWEG